jgi:hypothetical protein
MRFLAPCKSDRPRGSMDTALSVGAAPHGWPMGIARVVNQRLADPGYRGKAHSFAPGCQLRCQTPMSRPSSVKYANVFRHLAARSSLNFVNVFGCQTSAACLTADTFTKLREFISFFGSLWCQRIQPLDRSAHKGQSKGYLWGDRRRSI